MDLLQIMADVFPSLECEFHLFDDGLQILGSGIANVGTGLQLLDGNDINIDQILKLIDGLLRIVQTESSSGGSPFHVFVGIEILQDLECLLVPRLDLFGGIGESLDGLSGGGEICDGDGERFGLGRAHGSQTGQLTAERGPGEGVDGITSGQAVWDDKGPGIAVGAGRGGGGVILWRDIVGGSRDEKLMEVEVTLGLHHRGTAESRGHAREHAQSDLLLLVFVGHVRKAVGPAQAGAAFSTMLVI